MERQDVDREGTFLAEIEEYGVVQANPPSEAVGVAVKALLTEVWDFGTKEWVPWREYGMVAEGVIWVVKKDGSANNKGIESLCEHAGWDGKFSSVAENKWEPTRCQVVVKSDTYNNETRLKIAFINPLGATPGGSGNVDAAGAKLLDDRFGSTFRALAGNAELNRPKQAESKKDKPGKPPAPKPPAPKPQPQPAAVGGNVPVEDEIPF